MHIFLPANKMCIYYVLSKGELILHCPADNYFTRQKVRDRSPKKVDRNNK